MPKKLTELDEITSTSGSSLAYVVDYSNGSPISKKITVENLTGGVTASGTPQVGSILYLYNNCI